MVNTDPAPPPTDALPGAHAPTAVRRLHGWLGTAVAAVLAPATAALLSRAWDTCDVGVNNAANSGFLLWLFIPAMGTVLLLTWVAVGTLLGRHPVPHAIALAVALLAVAWCALSLFWEGPATPACPGGVPGWWPGFVPVPGF